MITDPAIIAYGPPDVRAAPIVAAVAAARAARDPAQMRRIMVAVYGADLVRAAETYFIAQLAADRAGAGELFDLGPALHMLAWIAERIPPPILGTPR